MNKYYMGGGCLLLRIESKAISNSLTSIYTHNLPSACDITSRFGIQTTLFRVRHEKEVSVC